MATHTARISACLEKMNLEGIKYLLVSSRANLYYLTGQILDTGERMTVLLLTPGERPILFIHEMFRDKAIKATDVEPVFWSDGFSPVALLAQKLQNNGDCGIENSWPSGYFFELQRQRPGLHYRTSAIVERLREIKDKEEIDVLRQSARITDAVLYEAIQLHRFPTGEKQLAASIRGLYAEHEVYDLAFPAIIGFGENSANPHHGTSERWIKEDEAAVIDIGGLFQGYCSDITRTYFFGNRNKHFELIYHIVQNAHEKAISLIRPGVSFAEVDLFIRNEFAKCGYERFFTHRTGHGIGLEPHEGPYIHQYNHEQMKEGMVFSIEPGIYLPGEFGVRIEDIVVVTHDGCEVLTNSPREISYIEKR